MPAFLKLPLGTTNRDRRRQDINLKYRFPYVPGRLLAALRLASMAAVLAGCSAVGDYRAPQAPQSTAYAPASAPVATQTASAPVAVGAAQRLDPARDIPYDWWTLFQSPKLNALIERALKANPSIA